MGKIIEQEEIPASLSPEIDTELGDPDMADDEILLEDSDFDDDLDPRKRRVGDDDLLESYDEDDEGYNPFDDYEKDEY